MSEAPFSPSSPQEYETPSSSLQNQDRVEPAEYEQFTMQEKKGTHPPVYHVLEPSSESNNEVYVNDTNLTSSSSGVYASVPGNSSVRVVGAGGSNRPPVIARRDYREMDGSKINGTTSVAEKSTSNVKPLYILAICLAVLVLLTALVIAIAALVLTLSTTSTCDCAGDINRLMSIAESQGNRINQLETDMLAAITSSIEQIKENEGLLIPEIESLIDTTQQLNATFDQRLDNVESRLHMLNKMVSEGVNLWNCTTEMESMCELTGPLGSCTTTPVEYSKNQQQERVTDFECLHVKSSTDTRGTLSSSAILRDETLACQCSVTGLALDIDQSMCVLKVTRCRPMLLFLQ